MSETQKPEDEQSGLPKAIPVKRETLHKVQAEVMDLPEAKVREVSTESETEEDLAADEEDDGSDEGAAVEEVALEEEEEELEEEAGSDLYFEKAEANLTRKALESTNRGKSIKSRRFVRGILHNAPFKVAFAAFFAIFARVAFVGALILLSLFLLNWAPAWTLWFALIFPVAAMIHIGSAHLARCRVCGQKEFLPSGALKHVKTHRLSFFGPIISTALHVLLFKWFRCMFCGTPVRIRK